MCGMAEGVAHPQKIKQSENIKLAILPAFSGVSTPATTKSVNVPANIRKLHRNKNIKMPLELTASVGSALAYRPIG